MTVETLIDGCYAARCSSFQVAYRQGSGVSFFVLRRALLDIATDLLTETGLVISPTIVDHARFDRTTAFATHVARDGVRL